MSRKNYDGQGRFRNKTVAFRVSPEEDALIESAVRMSGLTKQDYITRRLTDFSVVVQGNPRVFKGLRTEMKSILTELKRLNAGSQLAPDLISRIEMLTEIIVGMQNGSSWKPSGKERSNYE